MGYFAALVANSRALLMDCISMAVDAMTYMGNIFVECRKRDGGEHKLSMLIVCALSLSFLVYFTYDAGAESWDVAQACWTNTPLSEEGDDVNGWVTLAFGAGGLLFDVISVWYFRRSAKKSKDARPVNMLTAFPHVVADPRGRLRLLVPGCLHESVDRRDDPLWCSRGHLRVDQVGTQLHNYCRWPLACRCEGLATVTWLATFQRRAHALRWADGPKSFQTCTGAFVRPPNVDQLLW